jgi:biopolymer transport protein ExbD
MKKAILLSFFVATACMCAVSSHAQNVSLPQSETETKGIISAKGQLTDVPTVYV